jgi:hypothetical protein
LLNLAVAARNHVDLEGLVGLLMNVLLVEVASDVKASLRANLQGLHKTLLQELEVEHYPFELLLEALRELTPLVQSVSLSSTLSMEDTMPRLEGVQIRPFLTHHNPSSRTDLTLILEGVERGIELRALFNPRRCDIDRLCDFLECVRQLTSQSLEAPDRPVAELDFLVRTDQRAQDLVQASRTKNVAEF